MISLWVIIWEWLLRHRKLHLCSVPLYEPSLQLHCHVIIVVIETDIGEPRVASHLIWDQGWPSTTDPPASTSKVLRWGIQGHWHAQLSNTHLNIRRCIVRAKGPMQRQIWQWNALSYPCNQNIFREQWSVWEKVNTNFQTLHRTLQKQKSKTQLWLLEWVCVMYMSACVYTCVWCLWVCVCVWVCDVYVHVWCMWVWHACATVHIQKSEGNFMDWVLSIYSYLDSRDGAQICRLAWLVSSWAILLADQ